MKSSSVLLLAVTLMSSSISIMGYQGLYNGKWTIKSNSVAFALMEIGQLLGWGTAGIVTYLCCCCW
jgi:hypothetical protein